MHEFRALSVVGLLAFSAGVALAQSGPQGAEVVRGNVQIERNGANTVIRAGDRAIINYRSFDVASGELVRFVQPSANSRVLNRITGGTPTRIDGSIQANGRVYFVNRAGIAFGAGSVVDAGRFYAIAGNITDRDFVRGVDRFTLTGSVSNEGSISAKDGVVLAGQTVTNAGTISSVDASAVMVAGGQVLVREGEGRTFVSVGEVAARKPAARRVSLGGGDMLGSRLFAGEQTSQLSSSGGTSVTSTGTVVARQVHVESTGTASVAGAIDTSNMVGAGGDVRVLGERVRVAADIDARGTTHGGDVLIGGNWQGSGDERRAQTTIVTSDATINTSGVGTGSAGTAVVWADGHTSFAGRMLAQGGEQGGDGAWIEVSGKDTLDYKGFVNASASKGESGTLLLDPKNIIIDGSGSSSLTGTGFNVNASTTSTFTAAAVTSVLSTGTSVLLQANNDITINQAINVSAGGFGGSLTLQAVRSININNSISTDNGFVTLTANILAGQGTERDAGAASISFGAGGSINAGTGNVLLEMQNTTGNRIAGDITAGPIAANRLSLSGGTAIGQNGDFAVNELLIQTSSNVSLTRTGNSITKVAGDVFGSVDLAGTGAVTIDEISGVNQLRSTGAMTLDFGTILQNKPIDAPSLVATARSGGVLLPNVSNTVASIDLRSRVGQSSTVSNGGLTFTNNGNLSIAGLSTTSSAAILVQGELSQTGQINADTLTLTSYSNGTPTHTLLDTSNTIRELTFEGRNGVGNQISVANLNLADANGIVINLVDTLGRVRFQTAGDVVQGGGTMVRAAGVGYASTAGAITLTSSLNEIGDLSAIGASVNVFSSTPINVSTVLGQAGIDVTGFARLISSGSISQDGPINADHLIARTFNSGVVDINLAGANNDVNQLTLETLSTNGATLAANNIRFRDDDGYSVLRLRTAGSGRLGSNGAVNQTSANSGIVVGGSLSLLGTGEWSLTDARNIVPTFAGEGLSINLLNSVDMVIGTGVDGTSGVATDGTNNFLRIVNSGSIAQTDRIQGDQLVLRVVSDGDSFITLDNTNNNFARLTLESRTTGGAAGFSPITYRDADGFSLIRVTTASDAWFQASGAVNQTGANAPIVAERLQLTGSSGSWTLDRADNSFGLLAAAVNGNVNLTNTRDLVIGSMNGTDGVAVGSGNFFRVVNAGNISQTHAMSGDLLVVRTLSDVFTQALVNHPGNNFASVILQSNNRANSGLGSGRLAYRDVDAYSVHGAQTNEQLLLHAEGPVNQLGGTQPIIANGGMRFFGPGGFVFTRTDNRFPTIAGNTGTVFLTTATSLAVGQLGATSGLTTTTNASLTSFGAISQTRPLVVGGTLTATTRASGTGSITLSDLGNRATTANFQVYNGSSTNSAAGNVDWGSSNSYVVGQVRTLGLFTARTNGAATQNGSGIGSASVRVLGTGSFDFSNAANSFTSVAGAAGATNVRTSGALNITQLEGTDGLVSTGNVTLTAGGAITQNRQLRGLSLLATTRNDAGANITLTGPNNFFSGSRTLRTRNANDTSDVAASATYLQ